MEIASRFKVIMIAVAVALLPAAGCKPQARGDSRREAQSAQVDASASIEGHVAHASPLMSESPEAAVVRLSAVLDEGVARQDPNLLRSALHPSFPDREAEIARLIAEGGDERTAVEEVKGAEVEGDRAVVLATFRFSDHAERSKVLLLRENGRWSIAGMVKVGDA